MPIKKENIQETIAELKELIKSGEFAIRFEEGGLLRTALDEEKRFNRKKAAFVKKHQPAAKNENY